MATPTDTRNREIIPPSLKEVLKDASFALKWTHSTLDFRILSQFATVFMWAATSNLFRDEKTGKKWIDVADETS